MLFRSKEDMGEQPSADWNKESDANYGKLNAIETLRGDIAIGKDKVRKLPKAVKSNIKSDKITDMTTELARLKGIFEQNKDILSPDASAKLSTELSELEDAITNYGKNQSTVRDKAFYQNYLESNPKATATQLATKFRLKELEAMRDKYGLSHTNLGNAILIAGGRKKK